MPSPAVKLTIVVERLLKSAVERVLKDAKLGGWSIFPGGGRGSHGLHRIEAAHVVREFAIIKFEVVMRDREIAEAIARTLTEDVLAEQPGIVWIEAVEVLRASKF